MVGREPDYGPTARAVAENIALLRESQQLTFTRLSERLTKIGWPLTPAAVRRVENCERRVTVDDLAAFAIALKVSPATLLMPHVGTAGRERHVTVTGNQSHHSAITTAHDVWEWLTAQRFVLRTVDLLSFGSLSWPRWVRDEVEHDLQMEREWTQEAMNRLGNQLLHSSDSNPDTRS